MSNEFIGMSIKYFLLIFDSFMLEYINYCYLLFYLSYYVQINSIKMKLKNVFKQLNLINKVSRKQLYNIHFINY